LDLQERTLTSDDAWTWLRRANLFAQLRRFDEAFVALDAAEERSRTKVQRLPQRVAILGQAGRDTEATTLVGRAVARIKSALERGRLPGAWDDAIDLLVALERHAETIQLIDFVLDKNRSAARDRALLAQRARALSALAGNDPERWREAGEWFEKAAAIEDDLRLLWVDPAVQRASLWNSAASAYGRAGLPGYARASFAAAGVLIDDPYACAQCLRRNADAYEAAPTPSTAASFETIDENRYIDPLLLAS
jgi:tetratricopeptide (TPR) repeat protein